MTTRLRLMALTLILVLAMTAVGMFASSGRSRDTASSPYQSALSSVGVGTAEAAKHKCSHRICEFASPGYVCGDAYGSNCVLSGGCTTVTCPGF